LTTEKEAQPITAASIVKPETEKKNRQKMKVHTTNNIDTFIEVADDCPTDIGEIPKPKGNNKTVAEMQLELVLKILMNILLTMFYFKFMPTETI